MDSWAAAFASVWSDVWSFVEPLGWRGAVVFGVFVLAGLAIWRLGGRRGGG